MNDLSSTEASDRLRKMYQRSLSAKALFDWFDSRTNSARETKARVASAQTNCDYGEIIELFKELADIGVGQYVVGRKGAETRIVWEYDVKGLSRIAKGDVQELIGVPAGAIKDDDPEAGDDIMAHEFVLRPGLKVTLRLPIDLSDREADRLAGWVKSLPFGTVDS